ncbi:MAG: hypothetical protein ACD_76C00039G0006 [uncultured bacterium]|nr:MAG: hypothetical protein ACD_76C00039G0006 [uncultured bacterium]HBD05776.1 magnesium chelatase [Candidatus Uhrbacteria bacterium]
MQSTKIFSAALFGINAKPVEVEADLGGGTLFHIVGLPDAAVSESKQRVRSAIKNSYFRFPRGSVVVNLAPADIRKQGPSYDVAIALSILLATGELDQSDILPGSIFLGELSLDGRLRPIHGALVCATTAKERGFAHVFTPKENATEAALVGDIAIHPISNLRELVQVLKKETPISTQEQTKINDMLSDIPSAQSDLCHIRGQEQAKRAIEIAAAGAHNILMSGPPGSGKTLLARTMPTILPRLTFEESIEITKIFSMAGLLPDGKPVIATRPFRSPHHTSSGAALVGGGTWPRPGEISLAHRGVLFLDEFPEFSRTVLENLRQPLEDGVITVSRASCTVEFPAKCMLVAAKNPCPCGYATDASRRCTCNMRQIILYQKKLSGPILDRIDLFVDVPKVELDKLTCEQKAETSETVRSRVQNARDIQTSRLHKHGLLSNADIPPHLVGELCPMSDEARIVLKNAAQCLGFSARAYARVIKLARTIADLGGSDAIKTQHVAEAVQYRLVSQFNEH